jgi:hypothetical protein
LNKYNIKYSRDLIWLKPFVEALNISDILPLEKLKSIKGYRVTKGLDSQSYGSIITSNKRKYSINLETQIYSKKSQEYKDKSCEEILLTLAHELAHLVHWEHTPGHFRLEASILYYFSYTLQDLDINNHNALIEINN